MKNNHYYDQNYCVPSHQSVIAGAVMGSESWIIMAIERLKCENNKEKLQNECEHALHILLLKAKNGLVMDKNSKLIKLLQEELNILVNSNVDHQEYFLDKKTSIPEEISTSQVDNEDLVKDYQESQLNTFNWDC